MGDVGSESLGFALAVIVLAAMRERGDLLRLARRERVYVAHRSHAYQLQARRRNSHLRVTVDCWLIKLLLLAPWAWHCIQSLAYGAWFVAGAWIPLIFLAVVCGSGRPEIC